MYLPPSFQAAFFLLATPRCLFCYHADTILKPRKLGMNFEEKMKLAVAMAEFRINKAAIGEEHYLAFTRRELPSSVTYERDEYVQAVKGMFNLIQDLERQHNQSLNG
jgi:hypothetical protein